MMVPTVLGMEQPALLRHVGSTALRVAVARLRNSPCPPARPRHGSNSPRRPPLSCGTANLLGSRSSGALASVIREAGCSIHREAVRAEEPRLGRPGPLMCGCEDPREARPSGAMTIQPGRIGDPAGGWGAPQLGRRATTAAWASLRGAEALPDGTQVLTYAKSGSAKIGIGR
jgi:hypothetical protein